LCSVHMDMTLNTVEARNVKQVRQYK
jgi:hypothetical protein